jgi:hypothetical protein
VGALPFRSGKNYLKKTDFLPHLPFILYLWFAEDTEWKDGATFQLSLFCSYL